MFRRKQKQRLRRQTGQKREAKPTFSYHASRSRTESPARSRLGAETAKRINGPPWWHFAPSILAIAAITICLGYVLGLSSDPKIIQPADSSSVLLRPKVTYQTAAQKLFRESILSRSKITIDTGGITRKLKEQFPELANVTIALPLVGHRPLVYIEPSPPAISLIAGNGTFVINELGKAIINTDQTPLHTVKPLPVVLDQSGLTLKAGQAALPADYVNFITSVIAQLQAKKLEIKSMTLPARTNQLDVQLNGQPYTVKMNLKDDSRQQIGAFLAAKQMLEQTNQVPGSYFDVRVPERVYYK